MFRVHAQTLDDALSQVAGAHARTSRSRLEANRSRVCSPHYASGEVDRFVSGCEDSLKKRFPLPGDATSPNCRPDPKRCEGMFACSTPTAQQAACRKAADGELKRITAEVCLGAGMCFKLEGPPPEEEIYLR